MSYPVTKHFKNANSFLKLLKTKKESFWLSRGEKHTLKLFKEVYKNVPAYRKLLKINKINCDSIKTIKDFKNLPAIDKKNYLQKNDFHDLVPGGNLSKGNWNISATSGSTGEPFYFPRTSHQDLYYALTAEFYLLTNFDIDKKSTLYINCFALGVWIGGLFTYQAIKHIQEKNKYDLALINPGVNKEEALKVLKRLSPHYDQIIIGGYPPFIKDFVDYTNAKKFNWGKISAKFIFSGEAFSEDFRSYIAKGAKLKNIYKDTLSHYGTVDIGTKAYETPISILIRRLALKNKKFLNKLFGEHNRLPTLAQYIPEQFYFEEKNGALLCTSESGLPLIKYDLKDAGGVIGFGDMLKMARESGINLRQEIKKTRLSNTVWELPFVYIFERMDSVVSLYGANIYPENIRKVLISNTFKKYFSGRFSMQITFTKKQDQGFLVHIELQKNVAKNTALKTRVEKAIFEELKKVNSEYYNNFKAFGRKVYPKVMLWKYEDQKYFKRAGKHKWVVK